MDIGTSIVIWVIHSLVLAVRPNADGFASSGSTGVVRQVRV
jgi:hypothetical protein